MGKILKAYMLRVNEITGWSYKGYIGEIEDKLEILQQYVGGSIQLTSIGHGIEVLCNDDGKLMGLVPNRCFLNNDGKVLDVYVGNIACFRTDNDNLADIQEEDIPYIEQRLKAVMFIDKNMGVVIDPNPMKYEVES